MSDFLSRLVARSAGEQAAVRPRIVSAFAERRVGGERLPAGDVLESAPDAPRAMSPLVTETPHGKASARILRQGNVDEPASEVHRETSERFDYRDRPANALGSRAEEVDSEPRVLPMIQQAGIAHAGRVLPVRMARQEDLRAAFAQPALERPEAMTLRAIRIGREGEKDIKPTLAMNDVSREAHPRPALRPEIDKGSWPLEAAKKKSAKEPEVIQVTIGKIEVRASLVASKPTEKKTPNGAMSLDEYQRLRSRRSAG